jgi:hypothetical protein
MKRSYFNVGVDIAALVLFVFLASTGLLLVFSMPPGSGGSSVWGLTRHEWGDVHFWMAMTMLGVIAVHLYLHWKWILAKLKPLGHGKFSMRRVVVCVLALVALLAMALAPHFAEVTEAPRGFQHRAGRAEAVSTPVKPVAENR